MLESFETFWRTSLQSTFPSEIIAITTKALTSHAGNFRGTNTLIF